MEDQEQDFVFVYSPKNAQEIAFVKMVLEGARIRYYIQGESFYTVMTHLMPLTQDQVRVMVEASRAEEAKALLESRL